MKGRSYRFPTTDPHEDWVDGSWTVDCVCGVNFDDGEEMVNCDECGVWVHTRCSGYVKGDKLFTCDKCKNKNNVNDSEETEVAQLLVELPTKTLRMESSLGQNGPLRRPFRLWTELPKEEKVHVQGIPGGDSSLFEGLSSVFSRELWKCTGYVPKKFNFKYREFPSRDDEEQNECENGHQAENGAGVLFSMSKEHVVETPANALISTRSLDEKGTNSLKRDLKDTKWGSCEMGTKLSESSMDKKKSLLRPLVSNKRQKVLLGASKDRLKNKVKVTDKEANEKKGFVLKRDRPNGDSKPSDPQKDRYLEGFTSDVGNMKSEKSKETALEDSIDHVLASNNAATNDRVLGAGKQDDKVVNHVRIVVKSSVTNDSSVPEGKKASHNQTKEERHITMADPLEDKGEGSPGSCGKEAEIKDIKFDDGACDLIRQEMDEATDDGAGDCVESEGARTSTCQISGISQFDNSKPSSSLADEHKLKSLDRATDVGSSGDADKVDDLSRHLSRGRREFTGLEGSVAATQKDTFDLLQEPTKSCGPGPGYNRPKVVVCVGKSSSSSAEKSFGFENVKQTAIQSSEDNADDVAGETDRDDSSGKALKDQSKHSSGLKSIRQGHVSNSSAAANSSAKGSSAQASGGSIEAAGLVLNHHASPLQNKQSSSLGICQKGEKTGQSHVQSSSSSSRNHAHSSHALASNSGAPLSDEELALLLHQELNSSPRVPRVPRMRQPGSLPQTVSPAASSLLIKRSSGSGSKDHGSFSRRNSKETSKDGARTCREADDKRMKGTKLRYSPDCRTRDRKSRGSLYNTRGEDNEIQKTPYSTRKVLLPPSSTTSTSSGPCSSNEFNEHSMSSPHSSPRTHSDGALVHRTLPGLINEIMSKGKRMTYEELCKAVLPHWPKLRKHNGERYAYSSHSQAVLDCLRNRHEWAQLVDRGPKTNSSRKKRKAETEESDENESGKGLETSEAGAGKRREEFPKGKRKARKRRRLALQGKGIKDLRKKREEMSGEDDEEEEEEEEGAVSESSEESGSSEEDDKETGGGATSRSREGSSSSEDTETTS